MTCIYFLIICVSNDLFVRDISPFSSCFSSFRDRKIHFFWKWHFSPKGSDGVRDEWQDLLGISLHPPGLLSFLCRSTAILRRWWRDIILSSDVSWTCCDPFLQTKVWDNLRGRIHGAIHQGTVGTQYTMSLQSGSITRTRSKKTFSQFRRTLLEIYLRETILILVVYFLFVLAGKRINKLFPFHFVFFIDQETLTKSFSYTRQTLYRRILWDPAWPFTVSMWSRGIRSIFFSWYALFTAADGCGGKVFRTAE